MSIVAAPYGFRPIGLLGGQSFCGSTRMIKIASGYDTNVFNGDVVNIVTAGTMEKDTGTTTMTPAGIFMGCSFTDDNQSQFLQKNFWLADTTVSEDDAVGYILDDPDAVFMIQADGVVAQTALGANAGVVQGAGNTLNGKSRVSLSASSVNTTATLPLRIVGFVDGPDSAVGDAFTDCLVKWNFGIHQYETALGV